MADDVKDIILEHNQSAETLQKTFHGWFIFRSKEENSMFLFSTRRLYNNNSSTVEAAAAEPVLCLI